MAEHLNALRPVVPTVVVHPPTHNRVDDAGQPSRRWLFAGEAIRHSRIVFRIVLAALALIAPEVLPPPILCPARLESVPEEIERHVLVVPRPVVVLVVDDPRLRRMKLQGYWALEAWALGDVD